MNNLREAIDFKGFVFDIVFVVVFVVVVVIVVLLFLIYPKIS